LRVESRAPADQTRVIARIAHFPLEKARGQPKVIALSKKNDTQISTTNTQLFPMSQHRSLKGASTIAAKRNVLKRFERVELLKKRGQFKPGDKVIGLRKTKPDA
jgi:small basic protein (TIGR04137 family)